MYVWRWCVCVAPTVRSYCQITHYSAPVWVALLLEDVILQNFLNHTRPTCAVVIRKAALTGCILSVPDCMDALSFAGISSRNFVVVVVDGVRIGVHKCWNASYCAWITCVSVVRYCCTLWSLLAQFVAQRRVIMGTSEQLVINTR